MELAVRENRPERRSFGSIATGREMSLARSVRCALRLDTIDANYHYTSPEIGYLNDSHPLRPRRRGIIWGIARLAYLGVRRFSITELRAWLAARASGPVFFASTQNQYDALNGPMSRLEAPTLVVRPTVWLGGEGRHALSFPFGATALLSLLFIPATLLNWLRTGGYSKRSFRYVFDRHCLAHGMYLLWVRYLSNSAPACLVVSNDHNVENRVAIKAARDLGVPTLYLQHASVTSAFPPLSMDFALLEGEDSLRKYGRAGSTTARVYLVGMPKADQFEIRAPDRRPEAIGLCFNAFDSVSDVEAMCGALRTALPWMAVWVRPHPRTDEATLRATRGIADAYGCRFSEPRAEDVATFLRNVDLLVAGESSIHLEAILCDIRSLYYTGARPPTDVYSYHENGLIDAPIASLEALVEAVREASLSGGSVRHRAKSYVDTIGTERDGRSTDAVVEIVNQICSAGSVSSEGWEQLESESFAEVWRTAARGYE